MPAVTLPDAEGKDHVLLESLGKKLTVVVLWNAENPYALDQFQEMRTELVPLTDQGVQAVAIHVGTAPPDYAQRCAAGGEGAVPAGLRTASTSRSGPPHRLPRTYLLDAQGKILWLDLEYSRSTRYDLHNALRYYLEGVGEKKEEVGSRELEVRGRRGSQDSQRRRWESGWRSRETGARRADNCLPEQGGPSGEGRRGRDERDRRDGGDRLTIEDYMISDWRSENGRVGRLHFSNLKSFVRQSSIAPASPQPSASRLSSYASSRISTLANFCPSSIARLAPPPVLTCDTCSANPIC